MCVLHHIHIAFSTEYDHREATKSDLRPVWPGSVIPHEYSSNKIYIDFWTEVSLKKNTYKFETMREKIVCKHARTHTHTHFQRWKLLALSAVQVIETNPIYGK